MWFVKKSDYDSLLEECGRVQDEVAFYRGKFKETDNKLKEAEERLEMLYSQAKVDADARGRLAGRNREMEKELEELQRLRGVSMSYDNFKKYLNPEPTDPEIRRAYVGQIAGFFNGGLRDYLEYMIRLFKDEIALFPLSERETDFHRAGVNVCSLLVEWGDRMNNEHQANARGDKDTEDVFEAKDTAIENIREAINN